MVMTVMPFSRLRCRIAAAMSRRPAGSSMAVASSNTMHFGLIARMPAMATRCFWPPDSLAAECLAYSVIPTAFRHSSTVRRISAGGIPKFSGAKATSSSTTEATIWLSGFWNTIPQSWRSANAFSSSVVSMPPTVTRPPVGVRMPQSSLASVLLPLPLCPMMAV